MRKSIHTLELTVHIYQMDKCVDLFVKIGVATMMTTKNRNAKTNFHENNEIDEIFDQYCARLRLYIDILGYFSAV